MGMIKDKVTFCKDCGSYHRQSYNCSPETTAKEVEVVPNLAEPMVDEAEVSVTEAEEAEVLVKEEADVSETANDVVEDEKVTPEEKPAKKRKAKKAEPKVPSE